MKSGVRYYKGMICVLAIFGACLTGCGHNDADSGDAAKAPVMPSSMPASAQQQTIQAEGTASQAALAAQHSAEMRASKH